MDGYGCQLVTDFAANYAYRQAHNKAESNGKKIRKKTQIYYANVGYNLQEQQDALENIVSELARKTSYIKKSSMLSILVTDLSNFDTDAVFEKLREDGHIIHYIVVDHHVDSHGIGSSEQALKVQMFGGNQYVSCWATYPGDSATKILCDALEPDKVDYVSMAQTSWYYAYGKIDDMVEQLRRRYAILSSRANEISLSDTGTWGVWLMEKFEDISHVAKLRLGWNFFARYPDGGQLWLEQMKHICYDHASDDTRYMGGGRFWYDAYMLYSKLEWDKVIAEREKMRRSLRVWNEEYPAAHSVLAYLKELEIEARLLILDKDENGARVYPNFFMCAKSILEKKDGVK
ncbi:MAG: hypothetical protein K2F99_08030, partial [Muribaculaceae bacterium]|nr:hypothetical protein [Muribaculaceae bacterium]